MDLSMPISEREHACTAVVGGRQVFPGSAGRVGVSGDVRRADRIGMLVHEDINGSRLNYIWNLWENAVAKIKCHGNTDTRVHGIAAHSPGPATALLIGADVSICRTAIGRGATQSVATEQTVLEEKDVRVISTKVPGHIIIEPQIVEWLLTHVVSAGILVVVSIHEPGVDDLLMVIQACGPQGFGPGGSKSREQQSGKDGDYSDYD